MSAIPGFNDVLATISLGNQTEKVTKGELISLLSRYPIADQNHETVYREGIDNRRQHQAADAVPGQAEGTRDA